MFCLKFLQRHIHGDSYNFTIDVQSLVPESEEKSWKNQIVRSRGNNLAKLGDSVLGPDDLK